MGKVVWLSRERSTVKCKNERRKEMQWVNAAHSFPGARVNRMYRLTIQKVLGNLSELSSAEMYLFLFK